MTHLIMKTCKPQIITVNGIISIINRLDSESKREEIVQEMSSTALPTSQPPIDYLPPQVPHPNSPTVPNVRKPNGAKPALEWNVGE